VEAGNAARRSVVGPRPPRHWLLLNPRYALDTNFGAYGWVLGSMWRRIGGLVDQLANYEDLVGSGVR
jgi:hypothetical protein